MSIKAVLFDLDGTLLPLDNEDFVRVYFGSLTEYMEKAGYDREVFTRAIMAGIGAMFKNDGEKINEAVFWDAFSSVAGEVSAEQYAAFEDFYRTDFIKLKGICGYEANAGKLVKELKEQGVRVVIATQPAFPRTATEQRIAWAGIDMSDVELFTTFENSNFCKPKLDYYRSITEKIGISADECLMVGNDVDEDMVAGELGMSVFLVTKHLINKHGKDISGYRQGSFEELCEYISHVREK